MLVVKEKISSNSRLFHLIFFEPTHPSSYASYLLMKDEYSNLDVSVSEKNDWRYYFIVRRHFLRKKKKENGGHWICHYCNKPIYAIQERNKKFQINFKKYITIDHVIPKESCDDITDTSNMVECCYNCNQEKDATPYEIFIKQKQDGKK